MGHDFTCSSDGSRLYVSYNHCWPFYEYFDQEIGFRAIYDDYNGHPTGAELLPRLLTVQECLREIAPETYHLNYENAPHLIQDGWASKHTVDAVGNAYKMVQNIIDKCIQYPNATFSGD